MKEVQEKLLPGELAVSPRFLLLVPQEWGVKGVDYHFGERGVHRPRRSVALREPTWVTAFAGMTQREGILTLWGGPGPSWQ